MTEEERVPAEVHQLRGDIEVLTEERDRFQREADDQHAAAAQMRKAWRDRGEDLDRLNRRFLREVENSQLLSKAVEELQSANELLARQELAARAEVDHLKATVSNLERVAMRVHNFPSHPGGHKDDRSDEAMAPEDWRHGWICAVAAMQESAIDARRTQSDTVSDQVRSDMIREDLETLRRFARSHPDPATMEWFSQCATRYEMLAKGE